MTSFTGRAALAGLMLAATALPAAADLERRPVLTLDVAKAMAAGCEAKARASGWKMNISVLDTGANPIYFERMDGAYLGSGDISRRKAETAAKFPRSTRQFAEVAFGKEGKPGMVPGIALAPGVTAFPGGLPIMTADGIQVGGIGVSGGTSDQDELCAQAGIDAVKDQLK